MLKHFIYSSSSKPATSSLCSPYYRYSSKLSSFFCILSFLVIATSIDQTFYSATHYLAAVWLDSRHDLNTSLRFEQKESNEIFLICHLNKTLYELKQTSWEWYATLKVYLIFIDYQRIEIDHSMFTHQNDIIIAIYVNNLLILELNIFDIKVLKLQFAKHFQMKDLDSIKWYLKMHITHDKIEQTLWINQSIYIKWVIKFLSMSNCSSTKTSMHHRCQLKKNIYWKSEQ